MNALTPATVEALRELQQTIGENNKAKGFHDDQPSRDDFVAGERGARAFINAERCYQANLQMLIVSEAVEAHDEIRAGRAADETYYAEPHLPPSLVAEVGVEKARELMQADSADKPRKPEGVPSEIADGIIRGFDYFHRNGIDGARIIVEKIIFNVTRPHKARKEVLSMGYAFYTLPDGREAGYGVEATCDKPACETKIDRGLGYLCGENPNGHRDESEPGCGNYYCGTHSADHDCPNPECGAYSMEGALHCELAKPHDLPHRDEQGTEFTKTEEDEE